MGILLRHNLPRTIERGVSTTLTADVRDTAGDAQTVTAATIAITNGGATILATTAATTLDQPLTYALPATSATEPLSDRWLEVWTVTVGGVPYTLRRPAMHVRHAWHPTITDTDLVARHSDLLNAQVKPSSLDSYENYRNAAEEKIQRELLRKGRRPHLIFDAWELVDTHIECSLHLIFLDFASAIGDGRYKELADYYGKRWAESFAACQFRYDEDETGAIQTDETATTSAMLVVTSGRPNYGGAYTGRGIGGRR